MIGDNEMEEGEWRKMECQVCNMAAWYIRLPRVWERGAPNLVCRVCERNTPFEWLEDADRTAERLST